MTQSRNLKFLRNRIDAIDKEILCLLRQRFQLAKKAKKIKIKNHLKIEDLIREREIFEKNKKLAEKLKINNYFVIKLFKEIIKEAKRIQNE